MSANPEIGRILADPFVEEQDARVHAPEPWKRDGRYIRDALGAIVVRGRSAADARRIVAAINGTRGIPTEALESWSVQDVSDPGTRPDFEIDLEAEGEPSPHEIRPPGERPVERRQEDRRAPATVPDLEVLALDRRVFERRHADRSGTADSGEAPRIS